MAEPGDPGGTGAFVRKVARRRGWALSPVEDDLESIVRGLARNRDRYGYFLCPCREGWGERSKDRDVICPCEYAEADVAEHGHCYCGLYVAPEFLAAGGEVEPIPERRPLERMP